MRIAVCLSGQPRFLRLCAPLVKKHLIQPNSADVFIHTWWDESMVGQQNDTSIPQQQSIVGTVEPDVPALISTLSPKKYIIEKPKEFPESSELIGAPTAKPYSLCSNFFSISESVRLKSEYEKEHDFIYDMVVRARIDLWYGEDVDLKSVKNYEDSIVLTAHWQDIRQVFIPGLGDYTMDDCFAISSSRNIDIYAETYSKMKSINSCINPPFAENYLGWNCKIINGLKITTQHFPINIAQRVFNLDSTVERKEVIVGNKTVLIESTKPKIEEEKPFNNLNFNDFFI